MIARILSLVARRDSDLDLRVAPEWLTLHALTSPEETVIRQNFDVRRSISEGETEAMPNDE
jgi:hypothetical protein